MCAFMSLYDTLVFVTHYDSFSFDTNHNMQNITVQ